MKKKLVTGILLFTMAVTSLCGCRIGNTEFIIDKVVEDSHSAFYLNGEECSLVEARIYIANYKNLYGRVYGIDLWDANYDEKELEDYVKDVALSELCRITAMSQLAEKEKIALTDSEKDKMKEVAKEYYKSLSDDEKDFIDASQKEIEEAYLKYALANKLYETLTEGIDAEVSDDEARVIRIEQIFVKDTETANLVEEKLKSDDFTSVAVAYNQLPNVEVTVARGELPKEVEDIAFELDNDAKSSMITTDDGYYFIHCISKFEEELTEANKGNILILREKEHFDDMYQEYVGNSEFKLNEKQWKAISIKDLDSVKTDSFFETYKQRRK